MNVAYEVLPRFYIVVYKKRFYIVLYIKQVRRRGLRPRHERGLRGAAALDLVLYCFILFYIQYNVLYPRGLRPGHERGLRGGSALDLALCTVSCFIHHVILLCINCVL